jgi:DNA-binding NarL/FixJ family response regulator
VSPPLVVVTSARAFADALQRADREGATVVDGWRQEPGIVSAGEVADEADAAAALLAAVWGAEVLIHATAPPEVTERLVEDLRRLGPVDYRPTEAFAAAALTRDERALLGLLSQGMSLGDAADQLHLSRRTADRRLASARKKLGAETTAEAVVAFLRS